jgi:hypothetical protein
MWKDCEYQVLCVPCADKYRPKRLDLYGGTEIGHKLQLKGNK